MKNTKYVAPVLEYVELNLTDVITTSAAESGYGLSLEYSAGVKQ